MLRVPEDLQTAMAAHVVDGAVVCQYRAVGPVQSLPVRMASTTFVVVVEGTKHFRPAGTGAPVFASAGQVVAVRAGVHAMSEFAGEWAGYRSLVVSAPRQLLAGLVGTDATPEGPTAIGSTLTPHGQALADGLFASVAPDRPASERSFALRAFLVAVLSDPAVRDLVRRDVAGWTGTPEGRIRTVMDGHLWAPMGVADYAALCAMSVSSFKRHFSVAYGASPGRWIAHQRLDRAAQLLRGGTLSVEAVGEAVGYRDASTFIRAFRRRFGTTPLAHRRATA